MAWFSGVNLGNIGDLSNIGDLAGSLNKLGESVMSNMDKGFDIEELLQGKDGKDGDQQKLQQQQQHQQQQAQHSDGAGFSLALPLGGNLWDTGASPAKAETGGRGEHQGGSSLESFMPVPIPSLFGAPFAGAGGASGSGTRSVVKEERGPDGGVAIPDETQASSTTAETRGTDESSKTSSDEDGEPEAAEEGWGIDEDVVVPEEAEDDGFVVHASAGTEDGRTSQGLEKAQQDAVADTADNGAAANVSPTEAGPSDVEDVTGASAAGLHLQETEAEAKAGAEEPQGDWAEDLDVPTEEDAPAAVAAPDFAAEERDSLGLVQADGVASAEGAREEQPTAVTAEAVDENGTTETIVAEIVPTVGSQDEDESRRETAQGDVGGRHEAGYGAVQEAAAEQEAGSVLAQEARMEPEPELEEEPEPDTEPEAVADPTPGPPLQEPEAVLGVQSLEGAAGETAASPADPEQEREGVLETLGREEATGSSVVESQESSEVLVQEQNGMLENLQAPPGSGPEEQQELVESLRPTAQVPPGGMREQPGLSGAATLGEANADYPAGSANEEGFRFKESADLANTAGDLGPKGLNGFHEGGGLENEREERGHPVVELQGLAESRSGDKAGVQSPASPSAAAAHAALEAALAAAASSGSAAAALTFNHLAPGSPGESLLKEQLKSMEIALQNAARQAQARADELATMMQENDDLKAQLAEERVKKSNDAELEALREEYQHRLGAAERKVYALTKERDMLRREQNRKSDTSTLLKEKDQIIKQVMAEGEELSKKQAAQEASMKKLRNQLRELEEEKQRLASRLQVEEARVESIRKDKAATEKALQDSVERSQAELAAQKDFYHAALAQAKEALLQAEAKADVEARADIERKIKEAGERERVLLMSVEELRQALTRSEQQAAFREQLLRKDLEDMETRCQAAEARHEDLVARMPDSTRPLLRQIEAMQESTNMRVEALTGVERALNARLSEAEAKAAAAEERERAASERLTQTQSRLAVMEAQLSCLRAEQAQLTRTLEKERHRAAENRAEYLAAQEASAAADMRVKQLEVEVKEVRARARKDLQEEKSKRDSLEQELENERAALAEYQRKAKSEGRSVAEKAIAAAQAQQLPRTPGSGELLPTTISIRRVGSNSSTSSTPGEASILAASLQDSLAAAGLASSGSAGFGRSVVPAAALDQLEALLRQKDGELSTCLARITTLESTRDSLAEELVSSTAQVEQLKVDVSVLPGLKAELDALRRRHASALELMGERDEQVEELRADLQDVKEMYREQIDLLVDQIERLGKSINASGSL